MEEEADIQKRLNQVLVSQEVLGQDLNSGLTWFQILCSFRQGMVLTLALKIRRRISVRQISSPWGAHSLVGIILDPSLASYPTSKSWASAISSAIKTYFKFSHFSFFATALLLPPASTFSPLDYCSSFPTGLSASALFPLHAVLHTAAKEASSKHKAEQVIHLLRTLQWLPITLRIKSELLTMANQDPSDLTAAHWSDFVVSVLLFSSQVTPLWHFAIPWKCQAPFLTQGPHTSCSLCVEYSSYWFTPSFHFRFLLKCDLLSQKEYFN